VATTTATQPPPGQQAQQPPDDSHLIAVIVSALLAYWTVAEVTRALRIPLKAAGIGTMAIAAAAGLMLQWPAVSMEGTGPASRWVVRQNMLRRGSFFLNAARRTQLAIAQARAQGQPVKAAAAQAIANERRWFGQHVAASAARAQVGSAVDGIAAAHGGLVGWQAVKDKKCTPGCRAASGRNFRADRPPIVEGHPAFPGAVHGATCRCYPVAPFPGGRMLPSSPVTD
jgi:hypothetical protein